MKDRVKSIYIILGSIFVLIILCLVVIFTIGKSQVQPETVFHESPQRHLPQGVKLRIGKGCVKDIEYSPDGALLAVTTSLGIWLYDTSTDEVRDLLTINNSGIESISFSPDGKTLACGSRNGIVYLWDVKSGKRKQAFLRHRGPIFNVQFSADGNILVSICLHDTNLWDVRSATHKKTFSGYTYPRSAISINKDVMMLASAGGDKVRLSDVMTKEVMMELGGHKKGVKSVAFSPDGKTLASGSYDTTIRLWSLPEGVYRNTLKGHKKSINNMVFQC